MNTSEGHDGLHRLVATRYPTVLADPLLRPLFGAGHADHVPHLTEFLAEVFGGPPWVVGSSPTRPTGPDMRLRGWARGIDFTKREWGATTPGTPPRCC